MNKIITKIIAILIFYSCNYYNQNNSDILNSDELIAYIENPTQRGINSLMEGKLVVMDITTKRKYYISETKSYFNYPEWAKNGKTLIYFSDASNDKIIESLRTMIISKEICLFDIRSKSEQLLFPNLEMISPKLYLMRNRIDSTNNSDIFLIPQIETVYQINSKTYEIKKILELNSVYHIFNIDLSPNGKFLIMNVNNSSIEGLRQNELLYYSVQDSLLNRISTHFVSIIGGWDIQCENYIYTELKNILNYNMVTNSIDTLSLPIKNASYVAYTRNGNIIYLVNKVEGYPKPDEVFL